MPTDKTNPTLPILVAEYKLWSTNHLLKAADLALCLKVIRLIEEAKKLIEKVKMDLSSQE